MSKELEALRGIISKFNDMRVSLKSFYAFTQNVPPYIPDIDKELIVIETALKRLEKINNSFLVAIPRTTNKTNPLDELVVLQNILKIIKEKRVNVHLLILSDSLEKYNFNLLPYRKLTQEEFDLLKEYFK